MNQNTVSAAAMEAQHLLQVYAQMDLTPTRAEGVYIHCGERRLVDWYGGHAVAALGYAHPDMLATLDKQSRSLIFQSNAVPLEARARAADALCDFAPDGLTRAFFVNSGAEANENALRLAIRLTGRPRIAAIEHGFHGRTAAAGAVTWGAADGWYGYPRTPFDVDFIPRNDSEAAARLISGDTAAVIVEPVQGVAGAFDLDPVFLDTLARECAAAGALLIVDEVQSGIGRTGEPFAADLYGLKPDLMTLAKSLGGGFPCGALLLTDELARDIARGELGSTFGGGPLACAMIETVIRVIQRDHLMENVRDLSAQIAAALPLGPVTGIQGKGFLLGLKCSRAAKEVQSELLERNLLTGSSADPNVVRLLPPYVMQQEHVDELLTGLAALPEA
jgi:acetylornithine/succinyldiaminopimelate/putrescine aminotransferase